jgi:hypothetical protein
MNRYFPAIALTWLLMHIPVTQAEEIVMARSTLAFPEAMLALQESIREHGYTLSRVQRVDIGLTGMGYMFAAKPEEIRYLIEKAPQLIPYLPPKISIFAEGEQTIIATAHPKLYAEIAGDDIDPVLFERWTNDLLSILHDVRMAE